MSITCCLPPRCRTSCRRRLHHLEAWNEAVCAGRWGRAAAWAGERIRQGLDLEHWAAFEHSFNRLGRLIRSVASGRSTLGAGVDRGPVRRRSSRVRVASSRPDQRQGMDQHGGAGGVLTTAPPDAATAAVDLSGHDRSTVDPLHPSPCAGSRRRGAVDASWNVDEGPWFDNQIGTLTVAWPRGDVHPRALVPRRRRSATGDPPRDVTHR